MDFVESPRVWGFALDDSLDDVLSKFVTLTKQGYCAWVLFPLHLPTLQDLRVPTGFVLGP